MKGKQKMILNVQRKGREIDTREEIRRKKARGTIKKIAL